jgi:hypothetical protein
MLRVDGQGRAASDASARAAAPRRARSASCSRSPSPARWSRAPADLEEDTNVMRQLPVTLALALATTLTAAAQAPAVSESDTRTLNLAAYAELLRSDVRAQKVAILTEVMGFTSAEDTAFWPLYREYDTAMAALGDERLALIADYVAGYSAITDAAAESIAARALDLEARRHATRAKHFDRIKTVLPPRTALRFLQVEHQLLLLIDLQISSSLPIVQ